MLNLPRALPTLLAAVALTACAAPAAPPAPAAAPTRVSAASVPVAGATAAPTGAAAPPARVAVKFGTQRLSSDAAIYIAADQGYFADQGLDVELIDINTGQGSIPPLAAGQLDVGVGAVSSGLFNAMARGIDIKLVATKGSVGPDPHGDFLGTQSLLVASDLAASGAIQDFRGLRGRSLALPERGSGLDILLDRGLQPVGLSADDMEIKALSYADMLPALANRAVDTAFNLEPFVAQATGRGFARIWKSAADLYPGQQSGAVVYGPTMLRLGDEAGSRLMVAYTRGLRDYHEAFGARHRDRATVVDILIRNTPVKDPALYEQMHWTYLNPDCYLNQDALAWDLDWYIAHGFVTQRPDLPAVVDNRYCDGALAVLGRYQP